MRRGTRLQVVAVLALLIATLGFAAPASATGKGNKADKVDVCHVDDEGAYRLISISQKAHAAHANHGDGAPGGTVPGTIDTFADDCTIIPGAPTAVACATLGGAYSDDGVTSTCGPILGLTLTEFVDLALDIWEPACLAMSDTATIERTTIRLVDPTESIYRCDY